MLRNHRGMSETHMKRAAEWFLTLHEISLERAHDFIPSSTPDQEPEHTIEADEWPEPSYYDTNVTAEEGLWARSGWAGRT